MKGGKEKKKERGRQGEKNHFVDSMAKYLCMEWVGWTPVREFPRAVDRGSDAKGSVATGGWIICLSSHEHYVLSWSQFLSGFMIRKGLLASGFPVRNVMHTRLPDPGSSAPGQTLFFLGKGPKLILTSLLDEMGMKNMESLAEYLTTTDEEIDLKSSREPPCPRVGLL